MRLHVATTAKEAMTDVNWTACLDGDEGSFLPLSLVVVVCVLLCRAARVGMFTFKRRAGSKKQDVDNKDGQENEMNVVHSIVGVCQSTAT